MNRLLLRLMVTTLLSLSIMTVWAAEINITASFSPSLINPENNIFTNTTPQSGYCKNYPTQCPGLFSISMGGITAELKSEGFKANSEDRQGMYFKIPSGKRKVTVRNELTQKESTLFFKINAFSAMYHTKNNWSLADHNSAWKGGSFVNRPNPCSYTGVGWYPDYSYEWMWKWPGYDAACSKVAARDLSGEPYKITRTSFHYTLETPDPLKMEAGTYSGRLSLSVGPGGDIDFGDNLTLSDSILNINFLLTVNHELLLTPVDYSVSLQPCGSERICTEEQGRLNWERWIVTKLTPTLTGRSRFNLTSSGSFRVYLQCGQQIGRDCVLESENNPGQKVPFQTLLTLPVNIVDFATGGAVVRRKIFAENKSAENKFVTKTFGYDKKGSIDFLVDKKDVEMMLKKTPDTYKGVVTIIFDPQIY